MYDGWCVGALEDVIEKIIRLDPDNDNDDVEAWVRDLLWHSMGELSPLIISRCIV